MLLTLGYHMIVYKWLLFFINGINCHVNYIYIIKFQPLDAFSIIIIQFNVIKFINYDHIIFQNCNHPWHDINDYGHDYNEMV